MRFVRFLKTPRIVEEKNSSKAHVHCLITITSDLGDSFLPYDVTLSAELLSSAPEEKTIVRRTIQWGSGMRSLPIILPLSQARPIWPVRVRVGVDAKAKKDEFEKLHNEECRGVVSAWSAPLDPTRGIKEADKVVERRFGTRNGECVCVWEETGESIARHLWDAGITLSCFLHELIGRPIAGTSPAKESQAVEGPEPLRVLELGTGCGIVGIAVAQGIENAQVIMTDLPEAEEIVARNISHAKPANGSHVRFQHLDWDDELPQNLRAYSDSERNHALDMIFAADCTYNSDSSPALVETLKRLAEVSPCSVVVIAMKKRHSSEEIFFDLMSQKGFQIEDTKCIPLPGDERIGEESVLIYTFRLQGQMHTELRGLVDIGVSRGGS